jgi:hypothetical protein
MIISVYREVATGKIARAPAGSSPYGPPDFIYLGDHPDGLPTELTKVEGDNVVIDLNAAKAQLQDRIERAREAAQEKVLTGGGAKAAVYAAKATEVHDFRNLISTTALTALSAAQRRARFPYAMAEADLTGDTLAVVMARFEAGVVASRKEVARVEALAQRAKRNIAAAADWSAIQQAAAVDFSA